MQIAPHVLPFRRRFGTSSRVLCDFGVEFLRGLDGAAVKGRLGEG